MAGNMIYMGELAFIRQAWLEHGAMVKRIEHVEEVTYDFLRSVTVDELRDVPPHQIPNMEQYNMLIKPN